MQVEQALGNPCSFREWGGRDVNVTEDYNLLNL